MKRRKFLKASLCGSAILATDTTLFAQNAKNFKIFHTVMFKLKTKDKRKQNVFLKESKSSLSSIPEVVNFQVRKQISKKNPYEFQFYMTFESQKDYDSYNKNPIHLDYVKNRWDIEVDSFQEADFLVVI